VVLECLSHSVYACMVLVACLVHVCVYGFGQFMVLTGFRMGLVLRV
jgi:hypothetical protein